MKTFYKNSNFEYSKHQLHIIQKQNYSWFALIFRYVRES